MLRGGEGHDRGDSPRPGRTPAPRATVAAYALASSPARSSPTATFASPASATSHDLEAGAERGLRFDAAARAGDPLLLFLRLAEGAFEGRPFELRPWQAFIVGCLFGWYTRDADGEWVRRFRNAYVETGKGSGKTPLAAGIGLFGMVGDDEGAAEIYSAAAVRDQANILWTDAKRMVEKSPALANRIEVGAHALAMPSRNASFRAVSSEAKNLHGKRPHVVLIDEEHAHPGAEVIDAMRAGTKGRRNALIVRITNCGFDRHSVCWADHEYSDPRPRRRPRRRRLVRLRVRPRPVRRASPGRRADRRLPRLRPVDRRVGLAQGEPEPRRVSLPIRYLREMVTEAIGKPSAGEQHEAPVLLHLDRGLGQVARRGRLRAPRRRRWAGDAATRRRTGYGGLDIASTTDLTAFVLVAPRDTCDREGHTGRCYDLRARFWLPEANLPGRVSRDHVPYDLWAADGWITLTPGNRVDQERLVADVVGPAQRARRSGSTAGTRPG